MSVRWINGVIFLPTFFPVEGAVHSGKMCVSDDSLEVLPILHLEKQQRDGSYKEPGTRGFNRVQTE